MGPTSTLESGRKRFSKHHLHWALTFSLDIQVPCSSRVMGTFIFDTTPLLVMNIASDRRWQLPFCRVGVSVRTLFDNSIHRSVVDKPACKSFYPLYTCTISSAGVKKWKKIVLKQGLVVYGLDCYKMFQPSNPSSVTQNPAPYHKLRWQMPTWSSQGFPTHNL